MKKLIGFKSGLDGKTTCIEKLFGFENICIEKLFAWKINLYLKIAYIQKLLQTSKKMKSQEIWYMQFSHTCPIFVY